MTVPNNVLWLYLAVILDLTAESGGDVGFVIISDTD